MASGTTRLTTLRTGSEERGGIFYIRVEALVGLDELTEAYSTDVLILEGSKKLY